LSVAKTSRKEQYFKVNPPKSLCKTFMQFAMITGMWNMQSLERLNHELENIQEELKGLLAITPNCKIADFGCGSGYASMCMMLELHAADCIGVDNVNNWQWNIDEVRPYLNSITDAHADDLSNQLKQMLGEGRWPTFQQDDVLKSKELPNNLDLAYCKLLLVNIKADRINQVINNIVECIKQDGLVCLVERQNFRNSLAFVPKLKFLRLCQIERGIIMLNNQRNNSAVESVFVHIYRKR
jgi:SAM-dependent methyltransferase